MKFNHFCFIRAWWFTVKCWSLVWSIEVIIFSSLFHLCCSRCGLLRSIPSDVTPIWQNLMFVGMDDGFFPVISKILFCRNSALSLSCVYIGGSRDHYIWFCGPVFSRINQSRLQGHSECFLEERFELQELDFATWYDSTGAVWECGFRWNELWHFFSLALFPHTLPYRGKTGVLPILGVKWNWFQLQLLYVVFVLKQHVQAVVVISVSRRKWPYS